MARALRLALLTIAACLGGCAVHDYHASRDSFPARDRWVLLPWISRAEAPRVGERLEPVLRTLLMNRGVVSIDTVPPESAEEGLPILDDERRFRDAQEWAVNAGYSFGVYGSVTEWRYKAGLDGEPAVGLTVVVVDLRLNKVVWTASGARAGWGRESLSGAAQELLRELLSELDVAEAPHAE